MPCRCRTIHYFCGEMIFPVAFWSNTWHWQTQQLRLLILPIHNRLWDIQLALLTTPSRLKLAAAEFRLCWICWCFLSCEGFTCCLSKNSWFVLNSHIQSSSEVMHMWLQLWLSDNITFHLLCLLPFKPAVETCTFTICNQHVHQLQSACSPDAQQWPA